MSKVYQNAAIAMILQERDAQDEKFGPQEGHSGFVWLAILTEEVGELSQCILHGKFGGKASEKTLEEAVQTAAVAVAIVEKLISNHGKFPY